MVIRVEVGLEVVWSHEGKQRDVVNDSDSWTSGGGEEGGGKTIEDDMRRLGMEVVP